MHDLDRTQLEHPYEFEAAGETTLGEVLGELEHTGGEYETQELELASRLLEVQSEEELEYFLGDILSSAVRGAKALAATPTGQALTGILKDAAKQALPVVGGAIGRAVSPESGQAWGERAGRAAADILGLELEGLSHEDREFEAAKRVVQTGREAWRNLVHAGVAGQVPVAAAVRPAPGVTPTAAANQPAAVAARARANGMTPEQLRHHESAVAHHAVAEAAKRLMPGLAAALAVPHPVIPPHPGGTVPPHPGGLVTSPPLGGRPEAAVPRVVERPSQSFAGSGQVPSHLLGTVHPQHRDRRYHYLAGAVPGVAQAPSQAFATSGQVPTVATNGHAPVHRSLPAPAAGPAAVFAATPTAPLSGAAGLGTPISRVHHHLPREGRWQRHGRYLIVFLG